MSNLSWAMQELRFESLSKQGRIEWLASLLYLLSMLARDTYQVGTDGVVEPDQLRRFNELIHRTASFLGQVVHDKQSIPLKSFFLLLERETASLKIDQSDLLGRLQ